MFNLILPLHNLSIPRNMSKRTRTNASQTSDMSAMDKGVKWRSNVLFGTAGSLICIGFKTHFILKKIDTKISNLDKKIDRLDTKIDAKFYKPRPQSGISFAGLGDNLDKKLYAKFDNMHYLNYILISGVVYALTRKNNK
jgi:hypothetical protein